MLMQLFFKCRVHYADGRCDEACNTAECNWDGLDCSDVDLKADGVVSMVLLMTERDFRANLLVFLRDVGNELRANVKVALQKIQSI